MKLLLQRLLPRTSRLIKNSE